MKDFKLGVLFSAIVVTVAVATVIYLYVGNSVLSNNKASESNIQLSNYKENSSTIPGYDTNSKEAVSGPTTCVGGSLVAQKTWEMPAELKEISSIAWLGQNKVGAIQDNDGIIYVYNLLTQKVEQKIKFGAPGDYEGLTYAHGNFFTLRSDGLIYEVSPKGKVLHEYNLPMTVTDNTEPFYFDAANDRMIIGQKDGKKGAREKKFFSFSLATRKFNAQPVYSVQLNDPVVSCGSNLDADDEKGKKGKKKNRKGKKKNTNDIRPSELAIDPKSKDIFIADGPNQRVLVLSSAGKPKYYLTVDKSIFPQIEGMLFSPSGELYVSTEGIKKPAMIARMNILLAR